MERIIRWWWPRVDSDNLGQSSENKNQEGGEMIWVTAGDCLLRPD